MKIKRRVMTLCLVLAFCLIFTSCNITPKNNLKKGDKYKIVLTNNQKETVTNSNTITSTTKEEYTYEVTDVDSKGNITISATIDRISINEGSGTSAIVYDSKTNTDDSIPAYKIFKSILNKKLVVKMDKNQKVLSVSGIDAIIDEELNNLNIKDETLKENIEKTLKNIIGDDAIKNSFQEVTTITPNKSFKVGDTWEDNQKNEKLFNLSVKTKYTLKSVEDNDLIVDADSTIKTDKNGTPMDILGAKLSLNLTGTQKGSFKIDKDNIFVKSGTITQKIKGTGSVAVSDASMPATEIPIELENKLTYEVTKK